MKHIVVCLCLCSSLACKKNAPDLGDRIDPWLVPPGSFTMGIVIPPGHLAQSLGYSKRAMERIADFPGEHSYKQRINQPTWKKVASLAKEGQLKRAGLDPEGPAGLFLSEHDELVFALPVQDPNELRAFLEAKPIPEQEGVDSLGDFQCAVRSAYYVCVDRGVDLKDTTPKEVSSLAKYVKSFREGEADIELAVDIGALDEEVASLLWELRPIGSYRELIGFIRITPEHYSLRLLLRGEPVGAKGKYLRSRAVPPTYDAHLAGHDAFVRLNVAPEFMLTKNAHDALFPELTQSSGLFGGIMQLGIFAGSATVRMSLSKAIAKDDFRKLCILFGGSGEGPCSLSQAPPTSLKFIGKELNAHYSNQGDELRIAIGIDEPAPSAHHPASGSWAAPALAKLFAEPSAFSAFARGDILQEHLIGSLGATLGPLFQWMVAPVHSAGATIRSEEDGLHLHLVATPSPNESP